MKSIGILFLVFLSGFIKAQNREYIGEGKGYKIYIDNDFTKRDEDGNYFIKSYIVYNFVKVDDKIGVYKVHEVVEKTNCSYLVGKVSEAMYDHEGELLYYKRNQKYPMLVNTFSDEISKKKKEKVCK